MKINLCNTFEVVVPLWRGIVAQCSDHSMEVKLLISKGKYRNENHGYDDKFYDFVKIPNFLNSNKIANHIFYSLLSPINLTKSKSNLNIFFTQPPLYLIWGAFISRLNKTPYFIHVMDFQPDFLVAAGILRHDSFIYRFLNKRVTSALLKADKVIVIGRDMSEHIAKKGVAKDNILLFENLCPPLEVVDNDSPLEKYPRFATANLNKYGYVLYGGNLGRAHESKTILEAAKSISKTNGDIKIVFAGIGKRSEEVLEFAKQNNLTNICVFDFLRGPEYITLLQNASCHFITLRPEYTGLMVPSKFYSSVASAKPIIYEGSLNSEVALAVVEHDIGTVIEPTNSEALATGIVRYTEDDAYREKQSNNALSLNRSQYDFNHMVSNYCAMIEKEVSGRAIDAKT